jgi:hypothetical protein
MLIIHATLLFFQTIPATPLLENDFVRVFRNRAPCAAGTASCGDRVVVALGSMEGSGQKMERGDIKVFQTGEKYSPPTRLENTSKSLLSLGIPMRSPQVLSHLLHQVTRFCTMERNSPFLRRKCSQASSVRVTVTINAWVFP